MFIIGIDKAIFVLLLKAWYTNVYT